MRGAGVGEGRIGGAWRGRLGANDGMLHGGALRTGTLVAWQGRNGAGWRESSAFEQHMVVPEYRGVVAGRGSFCGALCQAPGTHSGGTGGGFLPINLARLLRSLADATIPPRHFC